MNIKSISCIPGKGGEVALKLITSSIIKRLQTSSAIAPKIEIPNRIERSPTDILKALERTVSKDPTAAHYKFHDDPHLQPTSNFQSRSFALSYESGRKAAMWVRQEHSDLFQHKVADPAIPSFYPAPNYTEKSQVSEDILISSIFSNRPEEALNIYHLLEGDVSTKTKQSLLELLCFHNSYKKDANDNNYEEFLEERWYSMYSKNETNTWKNNEETVLTLFEELKSKDAATAAAAYNAIICGSSKYLNCQYAWKLYEECLEKNIPLSVYTYNYIINTLATSQEETSLDNSLKNILQSMAKNHVEPNIGTLNAALKVATFISNVKVAKQFINSLIAEFKRLGIEPSLASYCYILIVYYHRDDKSSGDILLEILRNLNDKKLTIQDPKDFLFFPTAMEVASQILHDGDIGEKVHQLLLLDDNYKFINSNYVESLYYKMYTKLKLKTETLEEFIKFYDGHVPNTYIPESEVMLEIFNVFQLNSSDEMKSYLLKMWSHMVMFNFLDVQYLLHKILSLMCKHTSSTLADSIFHKQFADAALAAWEHINEKMSKSIKMMQLKGETLGYMAVLLLRDNRHDKVSDIISFMLSEEGAVVGTMQDNQINELLTGCVLNGHTKDAIKILQYASISGCTQLESMIGRASQVLPLTETEKSQLNAIMEGNY